MAKGKEIKTNAMRILEKNKIEFERGWVHSSRLYPFFCFTVQGLKKK
jgi:hypothetical protein